MRVNWINLEMAIKVKSANLYSLARTLKNGFHFCKFIAIETLKNYRRGQWPSPTRVNDFECKLRCLL